MTHKEENIVNIAMRAGELLKDGKIQRDDLTGHAGLTDEIIALAEEFEQLHAGMDWNDLDAPDYWESIDSFAEDKLLERFGIEPKENTVTLWARVGVTLEVPQETYEQLKTGDHAALQDVLKGRIGAVRLDGETYFPDLEQNAGLEEMEFDLPVSERLQASLTMEAPPIDAPVKVFAVSAFGVKRELFAGTWDECKDFCVDHDWTYVDENRFQWYMEMEDSREDQFPEYFYAALNYYNNKAGTDIQNEFVRQHAEELVHCYQNGRSLIDFDLWTWYDTVLGEQMSYEEYVQLDAGYEEDVMDLAPNDPEIPELKESLARIRGEAEKMRPSLAEQIRDAQDRRDVQREEARHTPEKEQDR